MLTIYHKTNCQTSISVLNLIKGSGKKYKIKLYLEQPLNLEELEKLLLLLQLPPEALVRKKEKIFQEKYAHKKLTGSDWLKLIAKHPILMERPILVKGKKAIIGRPIEQAAAFI
ncbi:MAG: arsenate reductase (glutaredoxin) [Bacteroidetes bacterium]|nr:arsenate reductase (glutaredoxin) [Bacteroidota bacterium]